MIQIRSIYFLLVLFVGTASAQTNIYKDSLNLPAGSSTNGDVTLYQNSLGLPAGAERKIGNTSLYTDSLNLPLGSSQSSPNPFDAFDDPSSPLNYKTKKLDF
jgi:hypothetical protein